MNKTKQVKRAAKNKMSKPRGPWRSAAKEKNLTVNEIKGGLLERAERLIILFVGILLAYLNTSYLTYIIVLLAVLTNITALQRIKIATKKR